MMRAAVANSNLMTSPADHGMLQLIPTCLIREHIIVFDARARLSYHFRYRIAPFLIVRRFLVPGRVFRCAIDFDQDKSGRIVLLLDNIESGNARLLYAMACILKRGHLECLNLIALDVDENVDDKHNSLLTSFNVRTGVYQIHRVRTSDSDKLQAAIVVLKNILAPPQLRKDLRRLGVRHVERGLELSSTSPQERIGCPFLKYG